MTTRNAIFDIVGDFATFYCPGCKGNHTIRIHGPHGWEWNGDPFTPSVTESVLVTSGHYMEGYNGGNACWCEHNKQLPLEDVNFECHRCHSMILDGQIQFLSDSSHILVNQTVPLYPRMLK